METRPSPLDDPANAAFAWARYKRLMWWMAGASSLTTVISLIILWYSAGSLPLLSMLFAAGGIFLTVMLGAALMGLIFLSSGSGHDDSIIDPIIDPIEDLGP